MPLALDTELPRLLPISSTKLERDWLKVAPFASVLDPKIPLIASSKYVDIPDDFIPWLILEYGVAWVQEWIADPRTALTEGLAINRLKGTKAGLLKALGWLGYDNVTVREADRPGIHFPEYQVDPGVDIRNLTELCRIASVAKYVQPVRSRLRRVFHGYDIPAFRLDHSPLDAHILDNYSGIVFDELSVCGSKRTGLIVSFRGYYSDELQEEGNDLGDYYVRENLYPDVITEGGWPTLDEDWPGSFSEPRMSAQDGRSTQIGSEPLQPVATWQAFDWQQEGFDLSGVIYDGHVSEEVEGGDPFSLLLADGDYLVDAEDDPIIYTED